MGEKVGWGRAIPRLGWRTGVDENKENVVEKGGEENEMEEKEERYG